MNDTYIRVDIYKFLIEHSVPFSWEEFDGIIAQLTKNNVVETDDVPF